MKNLILITLLSIGSIFAYDYGYKPVHSMLFPEKHYKYEPSIPLAENYVPTLRLSMTWNKYKKDEYKATCTGVVITPTLAVTARHCVLNLDDETGKAKKPSIVEAFTPTDPLAVGLVVEVAHYGGSQDVALLEGDFSKFNGAPLFNNQMSIANYMSFNEDISGTVGNCGFPYGSKEIACFSLFPKYFSLSRAVLRGYTAPGMSGSPIFDVNNGELLAIVVAVSQNPDEVIAVPAFKILDQLNVSY